MNSLVPPQEEQRQTSTGSQRTFFRNSSSSLYRRSLTGFAALAERGAQFIQEQASRLPLDLHSDADPARDKAISDSVRAGVVDDLGIEEGRRIVDEKQV